ncbi:MAG TPA: microcin C ABC transporter permease YejB [Alphaproteobacteria bacterium]|jgi:microcin C transport system permease protein|nr:microcin C ABC transporter permease YejB [Alphaproteobacteria bacterium]
MLAYIVRRLLLIIPTLFGIMLINFAIVQFAPGGPVEQTLAQVRQQAIGATARISGGGSEVVQTESSRGARGLDPQFIEELKKQYGFDKPAPERFWQMLKSYVRFDFGNSFYRDRSVVDLVLDKMPVSISLGLWTTLITYLISIPLGIRKAVRDGTQFDVWTSTLIFVGNAIPVFLFAILLIVVFAGGSYFQWFPLRGLVSDDWHDLSWPARIVDYFWHMALPLTALTVGSFASLTMLTKNSFLDEIHKQYVLTARAKGLTERQVLYGHVFRNAMLLVISGIPGTLLSILFTGSVLIEIIFSLDGLGQLGYESVINRDYPVVFGTLFFFSLLGLIVAIIRDVLYMLIDPRISFESRS